MGLRASIPERLKPDPESSFPAGWLAVAGTALYAIFGLLWITYSSDFAASISGSVVDLQSIETAKGYVFVGFTSAVTFIVLALFGRRVREQERQIVRQAETLARSEQAVLAGTMASSIAHDINNALMVAMGAVQLPGSTSSKDLMGALDGIADLSRRLLDLSSRMPERDELFEVTGHMEGFVRIASKQAVVRDRDLDFVSTGPLWLKGSPMLFTRAVLNMILNAAEATEENGRIMVTITNDGDLALVHVDDDGPGVPQEQREQLFRSFQTTKSDGHGLGLMSVVACAQRHGGEAFVGTSPLGGARFTLALPIRSEEGEYCEAPGGAGSLPAATG